MPHRARSKQPYTAECSEAWEDDGKTEDSPHRPVEHRKPRIWAALAFAPVLACSSPNPRFDLGDDSTTTQGATPVDGSSTDPGETPPAVTTVDPETSTGDSSGASSTVALDGPDTDASTSSMSTTAELDDTAGSETTSGGDGTSGSPGGGDERRVFLSSGSYTGAMGGVQGADANCQGLADAQQLGGTWLAFLFDPINTFANYPQAGGPFVKLNGEVVAQDWSDLTDGAIESPIDLTEQGQLVADIVWTGLFDVPPASTDNWCYGWTSAGGLCQTGFVHECGGAGQSFQTDVLWDGFFVYNCQQLHRLYCMEVVAG